jgi:hypothetical protein
LSIDRPRRLVTYLVFLFVAVSSAMDFAQKQNAATNVPLVVKGRIPPEYFGVVMAGIAARQSWPRLPVGSVRVFDSVWWRVEPAQGQFDFRLLDQDVAEAQEHHADLDLILCSPPTWASARPSESVSGHSPPGSRAEPARIGDWESYVRTVATRYLGRVHTYEMWNEANTRAAYTGDIPSLVSLCAAAYRVLKEVDPTITVISPSPAPENAFPFLRQFLTAGGQSTFDVLGFHFYDNLGRASINPELFLGTAQHIRVLLDQLHLPLKPIWNTESGYVIQSSGNASRPTVKFPPGTRPLAQDEAAAAVARSLILAWAAGVTRTYWYAWGEPQFALVDDMGATDKQATVAFRVITEWLQGSSYLSLKGSSNGLWVLSLAQPNGQHSWILWSSGQDLSFKAGPEIQATQISKLDGSSTPLSGSNITASQLPILLK